MSMSLGINDPVQTVGKRVEFAMTIRGLGFNELDKLIGSPNGYVSRLVGSKRSPRGEKLIVLAEKLNVDLAWLTSGKGAPPVDTGEKLGVGDRRQRAPGKLASIKPAEGRDDSPKRDDYKGRLMVRQMSFYSKADPEVRRVFESVVMHGGDKVKPARWLDLYTEIEEGFDAWVKGGRVGKFSIVPKGASDVEEKREEKSPRKRDRT